MIQNTSPKQLGWFYRFADWAKRLIAHPTHFTLFLVLTVIWLGWASARHWDTFSALVMNDYSTLAEYAFEILILASAISADMKSSQVIDELTNYQKFMANELVQLRTDFKQILSDEVKTEQLAEQILSHIDALEETHGNSS